MQIKSVFMGIFYFFKCVFSKSSSVSDDEDFFIDKRDGKRYGTIRIGQQVWMAENLAYLPDRGGVWVIQNDLSNRSECFYGWSTARKVAPDGWRLPSKKDFEKMLLMAGGAGENAFKELVKSDGFNATFTGWRRFNGAFEYRDLYSCFWTSSWFITGRVWYLYLRRSELDANLYRTKKDAAMPVRCIKC
jgi:uncharacterized protein (TIGR02145 family)